MVTENKEGEHSRLSGWILRFRQSAIVAPKKVNLGHHSPKTVRTVSGEKKKKETAEEQGGKKQA